MRKIIILGTLIAATASTTATAQRDARFDLVCTGRQTLATGKPATAWRERFRFDATTKRWCRGACATPAAISSITEDEITLYDSRAGMRGPTDVETTISRTTGKVSEVVRAGWSGSAFDLANGTCRREAFSDFPSRRF